MPENASFTHFLQQRQQWSIVGVESVSQNVRVAVEMPGGYFNAHKHARSICMCAGQFLRFLGPGNGIVICNSQKCQACFPRHIQQLRGDIFAIAGRCVRVQIGATGMNGARQRETHSGKRLTSRHALPCLAGGGGKRRQTQIGARRFPVLAATVQLPESDLVTSKIDVAVARRDADFPTKS